MDRTDVLKGFVTLDGPKIEKAEIQILLPAWNKGHPIQMRLDPDSPIIMPQISSCALLVSNAMEQLSLAQSEAQPVEVARLLTEAIKYCRSALSLLSNVDGQQPLVVGKLLDPPEGLIVSFGVQNARILATAYISGGHEGSSSNSLNNSTQGSSASTVRSMSRGSIGGSVLPKSLSTSYKTIDRGSGIVSPGTTSNHTETLVRVDSAVPALTATNEMLQHVIHNLTMLRTQMQKILGLVVNNIDKIH